MTTGQHHKKREIKMSDWVLYLITFMAGGMFGVMSMAILSVNRISKMEDKIAELQHRGKPTPRKFRTQLPRHLRDQ